LSIKEAAFKIKQQIIKALNSHLLNYQDVSPSSTVMESPGEVLSPTYA
jgi:hypothetical protein